MPSCVRLRLRRMSRSSASEVIGFSFWADSRERIRPRPATHPLIAMYIARTKVRMVQKTKKDAKLWLDMLVHRNSWIEKRIRDIKPSDLQFIDEEGPDAGCHEGTADLTVGASAMSRKAEQLLDLDNIALHS